MDEALYTGLDGESSGMFGNESVNEELKTKMQEQDRLLKELTPSIEALIEKIDSEIAKVTSIDRFITATTQPEKDIRAELQASALYKQYLGNLKTEFTLALQEAKRGTNGRKGIS